MPNVEVKDILIGNRLHLRISRRYDTVTARIVQERLRKTTNRVESVLQQTQDNARIHIHFLTLYFRINTTVSGGGQFGRAAG